MRTIFCPQITQKLNFTVLDFSYILDNHWGQHVYGIILENEIILGKLFVLWRKGITEVLNVKTNNETWPDT